MGGRGKALVTGATRGIGRQTALVLAEAGYDVAITGRTLREGDGVIAARATGGDDGVHAVPGSLASTAAEIEARGTQALPVVMDLADEQSVIAAVDAVHAAWGKVDVLVNNGFVHLPQQRLFEIDRASADAVWDGNFYHQVLLTRMVVARMLEGDGGLVANMVSGSATTDPRGLPGDGGWGLLYAASKAAFGRLAGIVNAEFAEAGVRAFNIDPGFVVTESGRARGGSREIEEKGFASADPTASGQVIAWLAAHPEDGAQEWLGRTIWAPKLAGALAAATDRVPQAEGVE